LLSGTLTGEKRHFRKKTSLFWEIKIGFSQKSSKFSTSEQRAQEGQAKFVFAQTKFVSANFPKKVADFWEIGLGKIFSRARSVYSQIAILVVIWQANDHQQSLQYGGLYGLWNRCHPPLQWRYLYQG